MTRQELTLGLEVARRYATLLTLLRGPGSEPIDPQALVGADLHAVHQLSQVSYLCAAAMGILAAFWGR